MSVEYADFLYYSGTNTPIVGEPVTVKIAGTDILASIYASDASPIANPVYSDIHGGFSFYVDANLSYDIYVQGAKQSNFTSAVNTDKADKNNTILTATSIGNALQVETGGDVKVFQRIKTPVLMLGATDVTATAAEINKLAGVTATTAEISYLDGLTSGIQGQLNVKLNVDSEAGQTHGTSSNIGGTLKLYSYDTGIGGTSSTLTANKQAITLSTDTYLVAESAVVQTRGNTVYLQARDIRVNGAAGVLQTTPVTSTSAGVIGDIRVTAEAIYVCTATNTWKRASLTAW